MTGGKFGGIPKFYQEKSSPIVQDSAFPPFKLEHRYKGVYERAGFDINKQRVVIDNGSNSFNGSNGLNDSHHHSTPSLRETSKVQPRYNSLNSNSKNLNSKLKYAIGEKNVGDRNTGYHNSRNSSKSSDSLRKYGYNHDGEAGVPRNVTKSNDRIVDAYNPRTNTNHRANANPSVNSFHPDHSNRSGHAIGVSGNPTNDNYPRITEAPGVPFESADYDNDNYNGNDSKNGNSFADNINRNYIEQPYNSVTKANGSDNYDHSEQHDDYDTSDANTSGNYHSNNSRIQYPHHHILNNHQNYQENEINQDYHPDHRHQQNPSHDNNNITHIKSNSSNSFTFKRDIDDRINSHPSSTLSANGLTAPTSSDNLFSDTDIIRSDSESTSPISLNHGIKEKQINHQHSNSKFSFYDRHGDNDANKNDNNDNVNQTPQSNSSIPTLVVSQAKSSQQFDPRSKSSNKAFNPHDLEHVYESPAGVPYPHTQRFSYGHSSSNKPQDDFKQFQSHQNDDYNDFLSDKNIDNNHMRHSALSMVSSIISKDSFTNDDDEVEHELQMQLASLKLSGGSALAIDSPSIQQNKAIPDINIDEVASINSNQTIPFDGSSPSSRDHPRSNYQPVMVEDHDDLNYVPPIETNSTIPTIEINEDTDDLSNASHSTIPEPIRPEHNSYPRIAEPINQTIHEQNSRQVRHEDASQQSNLQSPAPEAIVEPLDVESPSSRSKVEPLGPNDSFKHDSFKHDSFRSSVGNGVPYPIDDFDDSVRLGSFNTEELNEITSSTSYENLEPLFVRQSMKEAKFLNEINNHSINQSPKPILPSTSFDFSPDSIQSYNDSVKPLSPKVHQVEKELAGMNFKIGPVDSSPSEFTNKTFKTENENQIDTSQQDKPGEGPCRSCNYSIIPGSKGSQRPIFSKTGELSGQWHRSCFSCSFDDCNVVFNKNVQCYAFADFPYCNHHYHIVNNTICESCHLGIEGECIENELEQKWHLNCLKCQKCYNNIKQDYYVINNYIFCEKDAVNIINGKDGYNDSSGARKSGISKKDRIEKRRTRLLFLD